MLNCDWSDSNVSEYLAPNCVAEAGKRLGINDDRIRLALANAALREGRLGGAGLDVFETEPLPADSPLRSLENVFLSPHVGGNTFEAESFLLEVVGANLNRILDGEEPVNIVNGVTRVTAR